MKHFFVCLLIFASAEIAKAQIQQGTIIYERKTDLHRRMEDEQMKAMVPQFRTDKHELLFSDSTSVYKTKTERGDDVVAWYAEDIPSPAGPENFSGLPRAILLMNVNNGEIIFTAIELKNEIDAKELKEPSTGKHITRADFEKKMDELFGPP